MIGFCFFLLRAIGEGCRSLGNKRNSAEILQAIFGPNNNFIPPSQGFSGDNNGPNNNYIPPSQGFSGGSRRDNDFIQLGNYMGPNNNYMTHDPRQFPIQIPPNNWFIPQNNP